MTSAMPLPEFDHDMATTRQSLERVASEKGKWRPHQKTFLSAHQLRVFPRLLDVPLPSVYGSTSHEGWSA